MIPTRQVYPLDGARPHFKTVMKSTCMITSNYRNPGSLSPVDGPRVYVSSRFAPVGHGPHGSSCPDWTSDWVPFSCGALSTVVLKFSEPWSRQGP